LLISAYFLWSSWFCISVMLMTGLELILINFCCSFEAVMACNKLHQAIWRSYNFLLRNFLGFMWRLAV
jgi:hypothetical protein